MDRFHSEAARQRELLASLETTWESIVRFDEREFRLVLNPIRDHDGVKNGFVVEWDERTAVVQIERQLENVIDAVAAGDFTQRVTAADDIGFTSVVAHGVNGIVSQIREFFDELDAALTRMAGGDLTKTIDAPFQGQFEAMRGNVNGYVRRMRDILSEIAAAGEEIRSSSEQIAEGSTDLSKRAESQAASLEQTSATTEQMSKTIKSNAESATRATTTTTEAQTKAERAGEVTRDAVSAMGRIEESSSKISEIITVIDGIAFQTNLLALNAAVEAARAGDAGKGFAVVAAEVRTLAQRSSDAANDIKTLIESSSSHVADGVRLVEATGNSLEEIFGVINRVAETVASISTASSEQAVGVEEISVAVRHMDDLTQQNATLAQGSAEAAQRMAKEAQRLAGQITFFKTGDAGAKQAAPAATPAGRSTSAAAARRAPPPPAQAPAQAAAQARAQAPTPKAASGDDWAEF